MARHVLLSFANNGTLVNSSACPAIVRPVHFSPTLVPHSCPSACRLWQIVEWLAEAEDGDVLIVLDECHRAKNLVATEGRSTKTGIAVLALQNALPNAR